MRGLAHVLGTPGPQATEGPKNRMALLYGSDVATATGRKWWGCRLARRANQKPAVESGTVPTHSWKSEGTTHPSSTQGSIKTNYHHTLC